MEETKKVDSGVRDGVNVWAATGLGLLIGVFCACVIWESFENVSGAPIGLRTSVAIDIGLLPVLLFALIGMQVNKDHYKRRLERLFADIVIYADRQRREKPLLPERLSARISRYSHAEHTDDVSIWIMELVLAAENLAHEHEAIAANLDAIAAGVVPEYENKILPARVNHLIEAAEVWYNRAQKFEGEARELTMSAAAMTDFLVKATADVWAARGSLHNPQPFTIEPKQAPEYRRRLGVRALYLHRLLNPDIHLDYLAVLCPGWDEKLLTDTIFEAIARRVVDDNWRPCAELRAKLGGDCFEKRVKEAKDRLEAEERRHGKDSRVRLTQALREARERGT